jgi:hypothetical protein
VDCLADNPPNKMVLHQGKQQCDGHTQHVMGNGWKGVNINDGDCTAKDPHLLKVFYF